MKAILKYPGAKNRLAEWIVSYIPEHKVYLEPYAGSLAVFLNKPRSHIETVNDIHDEVVNFFKVVRDKGDDLYDRLKNTPYSRTEYDFSYQLMSTDDDVERARKFCVRCWQGFGCSNVYHSGFKSGQQAVSPNPAKGWTQLPETIKEAIERLKGVQIEHLDAVELIKRYNTPDVFIYLDPPYLNRTRKDHLYKHEMSDKQHIELLEIIIKHPGKILISGYENDLYNEMLQNWRKAHKNTIAESGHKRIETLWMNYDPEEPQLMMDI